jgi:hypothetical protein
MTEQSLQKLLKMKRLETPGPQYFDHFVEEFHRYQRTSILEDVREPVSRWQALSEFYSRWIARPAFAWSAGCAAALALLAVVSFSGGNTPANFANILQESNLQSTIASLFPGEIDLKGSSFDQDFASARFVTGEERLVAYDSHVSF